MNSSLRVAETVWMEGVFLKDYPPEAFTIKCLEVATLENQPHTLNLLFQKGLTGSPCNGRRPSAVWEAPQVLDEEDPGKSWKSDWAWDKSYIIIFRSSSLKASNWGGRQMTWDLRSLLEILCSQCQAPFDHQQTKPLGHKPSDWTYVCDWTTNANLKNLVPNKSSRENVTGIFQDEIEYWKIRMCRLTLLVEQVREGLALQS